MEFKKAVEEIKKEYEIRWVNMGCITIENDQFLDPYNICFVAILNEDNRALITDFAENLQEIEFEEKDMIEICKKHNLTYINYHIECEYTCNQNNLIR